MKDICIDYEILSQKIDLSRIEQIKLSNGNIKYRIWSTSSFSNNGKIISCGRTCTAKYISYTTDKDIHIDYSKKTNEEFYTEDIDFYSKQVGVDVRPFIGLSDKEFYNEVNKRCATKSD